MAGPLEVGKIPLSSGVMRLHALESIDKHGLTVEVNRALVSDGDGALGNTTRPISVPHRSPWIFKVGPVESCSILANMEAGRSPRDGEVYSGPLADGGLNSVRFLVLGELYREPLSIDCSLILAEAYVIYWQRGPEMRLGGIL